jgi:hypothetical protein
MSGYTPGPWVARESGDGDMRVATVCQIANWFVGPEFDTAHDVRYEDHVECEDDAKFIALAPKMFDLLRRLTQYEDCFDEARALIAHVEGV